jgi:hypothetical protein
MTRSQIILTAARDEYDRGVTDDKAGAPRVDHYIRHGLEWGWTRFYRPQKFEWCGAFAAWCYCVAGLLRTVRRKHLASCYRLWRWSGGAKPNELRVSKYALQPGDIAVCGPVPAKRKEWRRLRKKRPRWGRHIVLVLNVSGGLVHTFEGNATGQLKHGVTGEGVIRGTRPLHSTNDAEYRILYGVRPLPEHFDAT